MLISFPAKFGLWLTASYIIRDLLSVLCLLWLKLSHCCFILHHSHSLINCPGPCTSTPPHPFTQSFYPTTTPTLLWPLCTCCHYICFHLWLTPTQLHLLPPFHAYYHLNHSIPFTSTSSAPCTLPPRYICSHHNRFSPVMTISTPPPTLPHPLLSLILLLPL